jgi:seryl-tRNA synthetase
MENKLLARDKEIIQLKKVGEALREERKQLLKQLKIEFPHMAVNIENDNREKLLQAIKTLLEYLENMKNIDTNNADRINYAIKKIKEHIK